ncbi:hypothetical protein ACAN107058_19490 [Paracidovorax anthurii]
MKFDTAGPMASQLNTRRSCVESCAARPTWRCSAIIAAPEAPPVMSAARHSTGKAGHSTAPPAPTHATATAHPTGRLRPCRSA